MSLHPPDPPSSAITLLAESANQILKWKEPVSKPGDHIREWNGASGSKKQFDEQMVIAANLLQITFHTAKLFIDLHHIDGWRVYLRGELTPDERLKVINIMAYDPSLLAAWERDQETIRRFPYLRRIPGITGTATEREGPRQEGPVKKSGKARKPAYTSWE